jgi:hypothetical protein
LSEVVLLKGESYEERVLYYNSISFTCYPYPNRKESDQRFVQTITTLEANTIPVAYRSFHDFADGLFFNQSLGNPCDQSVYNIYAGKAHIKTTREKWNVAM